jgi:dihydrodipicolinate synthase/N-acetylneuraminate lyase
MTDARTSSAERARWFARLLPEGVPALWCPLLTHYTPDGALDRARIAAHLQFMSPWVKGLLVPGSTGDGWELTETETRQLLEIVLDEAKQLQLRLLIGALRPVEADARTVIMDTLRWLRARVPTGDEGDCLAQNRVCGFAVCPPRGAAVTQPEMESALIRILDLRVPLALYQLPQVTQNEMSAELVQRLARKFAHFILFKDTSGKDNVATSGRDVEGVFLVRGMKGDYARWPKAGGGPYDGFLLSTANSFGRQLHELLKNLQAGRPAEARAFSKQLSSLIEQMFELVHGIPDGNQFANAGKAIDHFFAHGPRAAILPPPRLHCGRSLPQEVIRRTGELLGQYQLMPQRGYLE